MNISLTCNRNNIIIYFMFTNPFMASSVVLETNIAQNTHVRFVLVARIAPTFKLKQHTSSFFINDLDPRKNNN